MDPRIRQGIIEAAQELGVSPVDVATAISYETAGTFDPMKKGPTTQHGQHIGLIQFGEPQRAENGVDLTNPDTAIASQLGRGGAVVKYLRAAGVQPGMGMLDIYSAINAGRVGRYNASDANNGGAPGNVRDKVETQMSGHRKNALALLGGNFDPRATNSGGADSGQAANPADRNPLRLAWAYANGKMNPQDAAIYERGMAAGVFPQAGGQPQPNQPPPLPNPLETYRGAAMGQQQQSPLMQLQAQAATNATPLQRFPGL